mmetsp:Transcript_1516/g.5853  ORF Transcript_1516/g.5853 Transcript_1516/m.5853 type:complete len:221 (+) Transcript_1516:582-1244(+)
MAGAPDAAPPPQPRRALTPGTREKAPARSPLAWPPAFEASSAPSGPAASHGCKLPAAAFLVTRYHAERRTGLDAVWSGPQTLALYAWAYSKIPPGPPLLAGRTARHGSRTTSTAGSSGGPATSSSSASSRTRSNLVGASDHGFAKSGARKYPTRRQLRCSSSRVTAPLLFCACSFFDEDDPPSSRKDGRQNWQSGPYWLAANLAPTYCSYLSTVTAETAR